MSSLTLITGTIDEAEDPFNRLDLSEIYYESWETDPESPNHIILSREPLPIRFYGMDQLRIVQYLGSGKTLKAMDILSSKVYYGGKVAANLGLVWGNEGKPKDDWTPVIQSMDDFRASDHCTNLLDDIKGTVLRWNAKESDLIAEIANAGRKSGRDDIITAQREKMIPPEIRDMATEWIVPIIRVRDFTKETPDGTGYPVEMICLHFDGAKVFKFMSEPIINLHRLFDSYSTLQKAIGLKSEAEGARPSQPGYELEAKAFEYLKTNVPGSWEHLNGKNVFDMMNETHFIDVTSMDADGNLRTEHKNMLRHLRTARKTGRVPYLMFPYKGDWGFIKITPDINDRTAGSKIDTYRVKVKTLTDIKNQ